MLIQSRPIQDVFLCSFSIYNSSIMVSILGFSVGISIIIMPCLIPARQYSRCLLCEDTGDYSLPATATLIGQWYCLKIQKKLTFYMCLSLHTYTSWLKKSIFFCNITISFPFTQCSDRAVESGYNRAILKSLTLLFPICWLCFWTRKVYNMCALRKAVHSSALLIHYRNRFKQNVSISVREV